MRHAGILRIDHVMSLNRLYWIPNGMEATDGCYVNYPFDDLVRLVALESQRQGCAVVGEDLGTVPEGFRETMRAANVLSYRIMMFERRTAAAASCRQPSTRRLRPRLGGDPRPCHPQRILARPRHRLASAAWALSGRGGRGGRGSRAPPRPPNAAGSAGRRGIACAGRVGPSFYRKQASQPISPDLGDAIQCYLARSRARLMLVQLEDVIGESEQANLPGTTDGHPNWRRRLSRTLEEIIAGPELPPDRPAGRGSAAALRQGHERAGPRAKSRSAPPTACNSTASSPFATLRSLVPYLAALGD